MPRRDILAVLFLYLTAFQPLAQITVADEALGDNGLSVVPADAAFFASWSRQGEQFNILRDSRAVKRFLELPSIRQSFAPLVDASIPTEDPELTAMREWLAHPAVRLALDAVSHEVFVYADASLTQTLETFHQMSATGVTARLNALARGKSEEEAKKIAFDAVRPMLNQLRLPSIVIGLKVDDREAALTQLTQLSQLIQATLADDETPPEYRARYKSETINGQQFQTINLDASMLRMTINADEDANPQDIEAFKEMLQSLTVVLAIGMHEDYVIASVGHSIDHLKKLSQGPTLIDHPDLQQIRQQTDKRLTSIRYTASQLRAQLRASESELARLSDYLGERTKGNEDISDETREKLQAALSALNKDLGQAPSDQPPAAIGFSYLTDDGFEGFDYNTVKLQEHHEPLSILEHVGDDPLVVIAGHSNLNAESYKKWKSRLEKTSAKININAQDAGFVLQQFRGFFVKLGDVMQENLIPALENGQAAWVISSTDQSDQWHPDMPKARQPLPLPEASLVMEIKDGAQLLKAVAKSYRVANELIEMLVQLTEGELDLAEMTLPAAIVEETPHGKVYSQPLTPDFTNIPANLISPSAGISEQWLVLSPRPSVAKLLLRPGTFRERVQRDEGSRHALTIAHVNVSRLMQLFAAWYSYAEQLSPLSEDASTDDIDAREFYRAAIDLAGCLRSYQRVTYAEDGQSVVHTVWKFEDRRGAAP